MATAEPYPGAINVYNVHENNWAIMRELGVNPAGSDADVVTRLNRMDWVYEKITASDTWDGLNNKLYVANAVDLVITLPATVAGLMITAVVETASATTGLSLSPNASDKIMGTGITAADDKDLINTAATDAVGDSVTLIGDGVDGWWIVNLIGTWAREA